MRRFRRSYSVVILAAALIVVGIVLCWKGCWTGSVPEGWKSVSAPPAPNDLMEGAWEGIWASDSKPLKGKLSAVIENIPDGSYRASFDFENPLGPNSKSVCVFRIQERGAAWKFEGKEDLGLLKGGTYQYKGSVDGETFVCTYNSTFDKGVFRMQRRKPATSPTGP